MGLPKVPTYLARCCKTWELAVGAPPGPCGICGQCPTPLNLEETPVVSIPIPHPTTGAVHAAAEVLAAAVQASGGVPVDDRVAFRDLPKIQQHVVRTQVLPIIGAATPQVAIRTAAALAAQLDEAGMHDAATLINRTADAWRAAAPDII